MKRCSNCTSQRLSAATEPKDHSDRVLGAGINTKECEFCGAALFQTENAKLCCTRGKYHIDFAFVFRAPENKLLELFRKAWPWKPKGVTERDPLTGEVLLTGVGSQSRKHNALFCLAVQ